MNLYIEKEGRWHSGGKRESPATERADNLFGKTLRQQGAVYETGWSGTAGGVSCLPLTWLCDLGPVAGCLSVPLPYLLSGGNASTTQLIVSARTK